MSKSDKSTHLPRFLLFALLLAAVAAFDGLTLRDGYGWGGDFAQYLHHAENLLDGKPYAEIGYVYNPQNITVGPKAYPPVFPVSLVPTLRLFGRNFVAIKIEMILFFIATVAVTSWLFSRDLTFVQVLIYAAVLGFSPAFWQYKESILSEHLFLPLWYLAILVADRWYRDRRVVISPVFHAALLGGIIYLAYGTRSVGIVLLPAVFLAEVLSERRLTRFGVVAMATALALIVVQKTLLTEAGQGYTEQLSQIGLATLKRNVRSNVVSIGNLWENGYSSLVAMAVTAVMFLVAGVKFVRVNWPKPTFLAIAAVLYLVLVTLWPSATGLRLMLPLLPAILFYTIFGVCDGKWSPGVQRNVLIGFSLLVFANYLACYSAADYGPIRGFQDKTAVELFDYVEDHAGPDEVCLFFKPRVLTFVTGRPASAYPLGNDSSELWKYVEKIGATVLIARKDSGTDLEAYVAEETDARMIEQWENEQFRVVRIGKP